MAPGSSEPPICIRPGRPADLDAVGRIQDQSPEAAHWPPVDYLEHVFVAAECGGELAGFLVARRIAPDETEILNLAVAPACRRRGVARALVDWLQSAHGGTLYLEVRESNSAARNFYKSYGFQEVGIRSEYYREPLEAAIVLKFFSC